MANSFPSYNHINTISIVLMLFEHILSSWFFNNGVSDEAILSF